MVYDPKDIVPKDMAVLFYRLGWKDRMKDWSKKKKQHVIKEMSDISLEKPITMMPAVEVIELKTVPNEKFSGLQIYAGMIEIAQDLGIPVTTEIDKMVELLYRGAKPKKDKILKEVV